MDTTAAMSSMNGMGSMSTSTIASMPSSTATGSSMEDMGGMGMGMGGDGACKISMLWNWYTIDACFLADSWHIRSGGAFAGSCIGVIVLVIALEGLRRMSREYDIYLAHSRSKKGLVVNETSALVDSSKIPSSSKDIATQSVRAAGATVFTPTLPEQLVRALLHMLQFAIAYIIMLLAMYFNGYIIICIFIGAFLGAFIFSWHSLPLLGSPSS